MRLLCPVSLGAIAVVQLRLCNWDGDLSPVFKHPLCYLFCKCQSIKVIATLVIH